MTRRACLLQHTSVSPDRKLIAVVGDNVDGLLVDSQSGKVQEVFHLKLFFLIIGIRIACVSIFLWEELVVFKTGKLHKIRNGKHPLLHLPLSTVLFFMLCPVGKLFTEEYI